MVIAMNRVDVQQAPPNELGGYNVVAKAEAVASAYESAKKTARDSPYTAGIQIWGRSFEREATDYARRSFIPKEAAESWIRHLKDSKRDISNGRVRTWDELGRYLQELRETDPWTKYLTIAINERRKGQPPRLKFNRFEEMYIGGCRVTLIGLDHHEVPGALSRAAINNLTFAPVGYDELLEEAVKDGVTSPKRYFDRRFLKSAEWYRKSGPMGIVVQGVYPFETSPTTGNGEKLEADNTLQAVTVPASKLKLLRWGRNGLPDMSRFPETVYVDPSYINFYRLKLPNGVKFEDQRTVETRSGKLEDIARENELTIITIVNTGGTLHDTNSREMSNGPLYIIGEPLVKSRTLVATYGEPDGHARDILDALGPLPFDHNIVLDSDVAWERTLEKNIGPHRLRTERDIREYLRTA